MLFCWLRMASGLLDEATLEEEDELALPLSVAAAPLGHKTISFFGALQCCARPHAACRLARARTVTWRRVHAQAASRC